MLLVNQQIMRVKPFIHEPITSTTNFALATGDKNLGCWRDNKNIMQKILIFSGERGPENLKRLQHDRH